MQKKLTVHVFDYTTYSGFTSEQIKNFKKAKRRKKRKLSSKPK